MLGKQVTLFTMFGFAVRVHVSWLIIAVLITWSLADGVFVQQTLSPVTRWIMGAAGALGLFVSVVFHELSHSLVARAYGLPMKGITLFIFGGVAEMGDEPPNAKTEFLMAVAGPLASVVLGGALLGAGVVISVIDVAPAVAMVVGWLGLINLILAAFNMIPGFPLDGGRVLRSILWAWKGNLRWATRIAAEVGGIFGFVLIAMGVLEVMMGEFVSGMWWFLIGMFIRYAAKQGYQQVLIRQTLKGEPISRFMNPNPVTLPSTMSLEDMVENFVYRYHFKMYPVVDGESLRGCATTAHLATVPRDQWRQRTVQEILDPCSDENVISPSDDALTALAVMNKTDNTRLMVVDGGHLSGVVSFKDLMKLMSLKMELCDKSP